MYRRDRPVAFNAASGGYLLRARCARYVDTTLYTVHRPPPPSLLGSLHKAARVLLTCALF